MRRKIKYPVKIYEVICILHSSSQKTLRLRVSAVKIKFELLSLNHPLRQMVLTFVERFLLVIGFGEIHIGRAEKTAQLAAHRFLFPRRLESFKPRMGVYPDGIVTFQRSRDAVADFFFFFGERAENSVPDDENSRVILVEILLVHAMMDSVMRRRVENIFEPAHFLDDFRVNPELIDQIQAVNENERPERETEKGERNVENPVR